MSAADLLGDLDAYYTPNPTATPAQSSQGVPRHSEFQQPLVAQDSDGSGSNITSGVISKQNYDPWTDFVSVPSVHKHPPEDEDDDWGEFETGAVQAEDTPSGFVQASDDPWELSVTSTNAAEHEAKLSNDQRFSNPKVTSPTSPTAPKSSELQRTTYKPPRPPRDENVLFDAEDDFEDEDEDGFGDFEDNQGPQPQSRSYEVTVMPIEQPKPVPEIRRPVQSSLVDFDWDETETSFENPVLPPTTVPSSQVVSSTLDDHVGPRIHGVSQPTPQDSFDKSILNDDTENWDDFTEAEPAVAPSFDFQGMRAELDEGAWADQPDPAPLNLTQLFPYQDTQSSVAAPSNIPPPAVILPLFMPILSTGQKELLEPLSHYTNAPATRSAILAHPSTEEFIASYLNVAIVLGRIIAGRKLRWKRDGILSQSMRIGPASTSGKSAGMKLTGVDKTENAREEHEVADVLKTWRIQLGKLRSTVSASDLQLKVPELSETLPVRTATQAEGAVVASRQCALCGLKRNERVQKVEGEVQDAFGEWWTEHWGHRSCRNFWDSQKQHLQGR